MINKGSRWRVVLFAAIALGAALTIAAVYFSRGPEPGSEEYDIEQLVEILDHTPGVNLDRGTIDISRDDLADSVTAVIAQAPDNRRWRVDPGDRNAGVGAESVEQREKLARLFADWVTLRADADAGAYHAWMTSRGCNLRTDDPTLDGRDKNYESATGSPYTPGVSSQELFTTMFDATMRWKDGIIRPVDLGDVEMRFGWCRSPKPDIETELRGDQISLLWWGGKTSHGGIRYFDPPRTYGQVFHRDHKVFGGAVFAACLGENGGWVVIRFYAYWDPIARQWWINNITATNLNKSMIGTGIVY